MTHGNGGPIEPGWMGDMHDEPELVMPMPLGSAASLDLLAQQINEEFSSTLEGARRTLGHAIRCGELLTRARATIRPGEWMAWCDVHLRLSYEMIGVYMRLSEHAEEVKASGADTIAAADRFVRAMGLPDRPRSLLGHREGRMRIDVSDEIRDGVRGRRAAGIGIRTLSREFGLDRSVIERIVDPEFTKKRQKEARALRARRRAERQALAREKERALKEIERRERAANARAVGGNAEKAWASLLSTLKSLDLELGRQDHRDARELILTAIRQGHAMEATVNSLIAHMRGRAMDAPESRAD